MCKVDLPPTNSNVSKVIEWGNSIEVLPNLFRMFYNVDIRDTMMEHSKLDPQNVNDSHPPLYFFLKSTKYDRFRYLILYAQTTYSTKNENFNHNGLHTNLLKTIFGLQRWNPMICKEPKNNTTMFCQYCGKLWGWPKILGGCLGWLRKNTIFPKYWKSWF